MFQSKQIDRKNYKKLNKHFHETFAGHLPSLPDGAHHAPLFVARADLLFIF
jgi:hypothetical protein